MTFKSKGFEINYISSDYSIKKVILENKEYYRYTITDFRSESKHYFNCPECKKNSIMLESSNVDKNFNNKTSKILKCLNCLAKYHVKVSYCEPNNGRDVYYISHIYLIE